MAEVRQILDEKFQLPLLDKGGAVYNVKHPDFGAVGDGVTDDTIAVQDALDASEVADGTCYFPDGIYLIGIAGLSSECRSIIMSPGAKLLYNDGSGACLQIGTATSEIVEGEFVIRAERVTADWDSASGSGDDNSSIGILFINLRRSYVRIPYCWNFARGFELRGDALGDYGGSTENEIHLGAIRENKVQVALRRVNGGWVNQNQFYGGKLRISTANPTHTKDVSGSKLLDVGTTNGNIFIGTNFEGTYHEQAIYCDGIRNVFLLTRHEANEANEIHFGSSSQDNMMLWPVGGTGIWLAPGEAVYNDEGARNAIISDQGSILFSAGNTNRNTALTLAGINAALRTRNTNNDGEHFELGASGDAKWYDEGIGSDEPWLHIEPTTRKIYFGDGSATPVETFRGWPGGVLRMTGGTLQLQGGQIAAPGGLIADGDTTPDVDGQMVFKTQNSNPTTITDFENEAVARVFLFIIAGDNNTTIQHNAKISLSGSTDFIMSPGDVIEFLSDRISGSNVWREVSRTVV